MISRVSDYLHPDESLILLIRRHPASLIAPIILVAAGLTAALLYTASSRNSGIVILIWSACGLLVLNLIYKALAWWAACFVVTSKRMLLITGVVTRWSESQDLDKVTDIGFARSVVGHLLGYGSFLFSTADNDQLYLRLNYVPSNAFDRIARALPSNAQQVTVERGGDEVAVDKDQPISVDEDSDRLRRRKSIILIVIWIAALAAALVVAEIPRIGTLANSELPIIAVALAATGPIVGGRWTSGR